MRQASQGAELCLFRVACCRCQLDQGAFSEACSCHSAAAMRCPMCHPKCPAGHEASCLLPCIRWPTGHTWPSGLSACALDSDSVIAGAWLSLSRWLLWLLLQAQSVPILSKLIPTCVCSSTFVFGAPVPRVGIRVPHGGRIMSRLLWGW